MLGYGTVMRRLALAAAMLLLGGMADWKPLTWPDLTSRPRPAPQATIAYGPAPEQKVDVWLPAGPGPHKTVLMVHGGCWQTSIADRSLMNWLAEDLRGRGYAVWNVDYRGIDRAGGGYPGTFADVAAAADALRANAARFRLDMRRIVAVGHSAGGHLALWLAGRGKLPADSPLRSAGPLPIAAVVSLGGLPDLEAVAASPDNGCGTEVVGKLVGERPNAFADTSVPRLLPLGAEQWIVAGENDRIIPMRLNLSYFEAARAAGDPVALVRVPQTGHVELIAPESTAWKQSVALIARSFE